MPIDDYVSILFLHIQWQWFKMFFKVKRETKTLKKYGKSYPKKQTVTPLNEGLPSTGRAFFPLRVNFFFLLSPHYHPFSSGPNLYSQLPLLLFWSPHTYPFVKKNYMHILLFSNFLALFSSGTFLFVFTRFQHISPIQGNLLEPLQQLYPNY